MATPSVARGAVIAALGVGLAASPSGAAVPQTLAFVDHGRIEVVDLRKASATEIRPNERFRRYEEISWAPDHRRLAAIGVSRRGSIRRLVIIGLRSGAQSLVPGGLHAQMPAWSPDGRLIAFAQRTGRQTPDNGPGYRLLVVRPGAGLPRTVSGRAQMVDSSPVWSRDSKYISFVADGDGENLLFAARPDANRPSLVSRSPEYNFDFTDSTWLTGDRILFVHFVGGVDGEEDTLESIGPAGQKRHRYRLNPHDLLFGIASPDGSLVPVYDDGPGLSLMSADETLAVVPTGQAESVEGVTWSPDGASFAFFRERPARPGICALVSAGFASRTDLFVVDTATRRERRILTLPYSASCPRFQTDTFSGFTWGTPAEAQPGD